MTDNRESVKSAVQALEEKMGENIRVIDISRISVVADYFIIASGKNVNQIRAMADAVEEKLGKNGIVPKQVEGYNTAGWILMDYKDFIIHIFNEEQRLFYDIERIWSDGLVLDPKDL